MAASASGTDQLGGTLDLVEPDKKKTARSRCSARLESLIVSSLVARLGIRFREGEGGDVHAF